jgi:hypothetical protein
MNRKEIAHKEATRDPIFLFQLPRVFLNEDGFYSTEYDSDCGELVETDTKKVVHDSDLVARNWANVCWDTIDVYLTRGEAEAFGEATQYRYGTKGKNIDWRVYCIALEQDSMLAEMLRQREDEPK